MQLDAPAVRLDHHHVSRGEVFFRTTSLRTVDLVLRHINYRTAIVDERLMSRAFPYVAPASRRWAVVMLAGRLDVNPRPVLSAAGGDCVLFGRRGKRDARWTQGNFIELEWTAARGNPSPAATLLAKADLRQAREVAAALDDREADESHALELGLALFRSVGIAIPDSLGTPRHKPTEQDRRLVHALEQQINDLKGRATTIDLVDTTGRSARQLQRVLQRFNEQYGINATSWRDVRNRCRVQVAAFLLSHPDLPVAEIATEVGYASPNAMTRAFAKSRLPSPARFREAVLKVPSL